METYENSQKYSKINSRSNNIQSHSLAELLKTRRKELKLSLEDVEKITKIRRKYLKFIESGDYNKLEDNVYTTGYIKNYAEFLDFDTRQILKLYNLERQKINPEKTKTKGPMSLKPIDSAGYIFTPKIILIILAVIFITTLTGYVGWQFSQLSAPPNITLNNQLESTVNTNFVIVSGEVDGGSDVFINDSPILTSPDGSFSERIALVNGANQIIIKARNKFGKESTKTIIVHTKIATPESEIPQLSLATIDGVEVLINVVDKATWIVIQTDDQDAFRGTMLPNTQRLFKAKSNIKVTTGNAGSTQLIITNSKVARHDLGRLGKQDEAKLDLVFTKDTEFGN